MDKFLKTNFATSKIIKRPDPKDLATQKKGKTILNIDKKDTSRQKSVDKVKNNLSDMLNHVIPSLNQNHDSSKMDIEEEKGTPVKKILKVKKSNKLSDQKEVLSKGKSYANKLKEEKEEEEIVEDIIPQRKSKERVTPLKKAAHTRNLSPQEIEIDDDQNESQSSLKKGIKKLKLTKLSEKPKKANVKVTAKEKCLIEERKVNRYSESESDSQSDDNEKGHVEFVEGEGDNFLANSKFNKSSKKEDGMKQKTLKFEKTKLAAQKAQEIQTKVSIDSFLPVSIGSMQNGFKKEEEEEYMVECDQDNDEPLSDEELIKQIELMQSEKKRQQQQQQQQQEQKEEIDEDQEMQKNIEKDNLYLEEVAYLKDKKNQENIIAEPAETINSEEELNLSSKDDNGDTNFVSQMQGKYFTVNGKPTEEGINILVLDNLIKRNGGFITSNINKKLNYMIVCGKEVNKSKKEYAIELNVKILTEEEFIQRLLEYHNCDVKELINKYTSVIAQNSSPQKNNLQGTSSSVTKDSHNQISVAQKSTFAQSCPSTQELPKQQQQSKKPTSNSQVTKQPTQQLPGNLLSCWIPQSALAATETFESFNDTQESKPLPQAQTKKPRKAIQEIDIEEIELEVETKPTQKSIKEPAKNINQQVKMQSQTPSNQPKHSINQLWTHKYAPSDLKHCVGNKEQINKIKQWLENWENVIIHKKYSSQSNWRTNPNARACLISGPPGIGKTTTVRLLAQQLGMSLIEWNASDVRNKNAIETIVNPLRNNQVLNSQGQLGGTEGKQRSIILMDEVDGMSTGDIGGNQTLMKIIKDTQNPIFCICNDRYNQKLRSLAGVCFDVRFQKPSNFEVADRLASVCNREGILYEMKTLEMLSEGANSDIRQSLNLLQMQAKKSKILSSNTFADTQSFKKDTSVSLNIFEATKILSTRSLFHKMDISQKQDLFFLDYEMMPLMIQENYLNQNFNYSTSFLELQNIAKAAQVFAESDLIGNSIRSKGNWSLLQDQGFLTAAYAPNVFCMNSFEKAQMTQVLGKMSSQRKTNRLIRELRIAMAEHISGNRMAAQLDYAEPIMELILHYLAEDGKEGVNIVLNIMENYCITPEILKEHLVVLNYNKNIEERLKNIPTTVKTALTKAYNKRFKDDVKPEKKKDRPEEDADQAFISNETNEQDNGDDNSPANQETNADGNEEQQQDQGDLQEEENITNEEKNSKNLLKLKPKATKSAAGTGKQPVSKANSSKSVSSQGSIQFKKNTKK